MQKLAKYRSLIGEAAGDPSGICVLRRRCWIPCEINSKVRRNSNGFPFFLRLLRERATFSLFFLIIAYLPPPARPVRSPRLRPVGEGLYTCILEH